MMKLTNLFVVLNRVCLIACLFIFNSTACIDDDKTVDIKPDEECLDFNDLSSGDGQDFTCYDANQIVTNTTGFGTADEKDLFDYLTNQGYIKVDSCECAADLNLWEYQKLNNDPNIIGVVDGAKQKGKGVGQGDGVSLNYQIKLPEGTIVPKGTSAVNMQPAHAGVKVGVVDAGVNSHNLLSDNFRSNNTPDYCKSGVADHAYGIDMMKKQVNLIPLDEHGHGTFVNGIIAGDAQPVVLAYNGINVTLLNVKATQNKGTTVDFFKAVCGMYYLLEQEVSVINLSWGFLDTIPPMIMVPLLTKVEEQGVMIVAGAGNGSLKVTKPLFFWPAAFSSPSVDAAFDLDSKGNEVMLAVGAYDQNKNRLAVFSNWGEMIDITAPGVDITSTSHTAQDALSMSSGSSMSAAYVSRTLAILQVIHPHLSPLQLKNCLLASADLVTAIPNSSTYAETLLLNHGNALQCSLPN